MCLVLYMASDRIRPTIPWDEANPSFHVRDDDPDAPRTRRQFSKPNIYYLGSDEGCGCGFPREHDISLEDSEKAESKAANIKRLHDYLSECLHDEASVELYSCWSGDEDSGPDFKRVVSIDDILKRNFHFSEKQLTTVETQSD